MNHAEIGWAQAGAKIIAGNTTIGVIGMASQQVLDKFDFKNTTICGAELDLEQLLSLRSGPAKAKQLAEIPRHKARPVVGCE